jgi:hypothetical protein
MLIAYQSGSEYIKWQSKFLEKVKRNFQESRGGRQIGNTSPIPDVYSALDE